MSKLKQAEHGYFHWCPGCEETHYIAVDKPLDNGAKWSFNGDMEKPTFGPSVRISCPCDDGDPENWPFPEVCHYFIRDGKIEFCGDSDHKFSGKTVDLPEVPESVF